MGAFKMRSSRNCLLPVIALLSIVVTLSLGSVAARAQSSSFKNVGRAPSDAEIRAWDIEIAIDGKGLPPGRGTAREGAAIYARKCAACHGPTGEEIASAPRLV